MGAGTLVAEASADGIANPLSADASIAPCLVIYIESASTGAGQAVPVSSFTHGTLTYNLLHNWPLTPTGTIVYKVYSIARMPASEPSGSRCHPALLWRCEAHRAPVRVEPDQSGFEAAPTGCHWISERCCR